MALSLPESCGRIRFFKLSDVIAIDVKLSLSTESFYFMLCSGRTVHPKEIVELAVRYELGRRGWIYSETWGAGLARIAHQSAR